MRSIQRMAREASLSRTAAADAVDAAFSAIGDALTKEETLRITAFGTFSTRVWPVRNTRNPRRTGESVDVPASKAAFFKVGKILRDRLNRE